MHGELSHSASGWFKGNLHFPKPTRLVPSCVFGPVRNAEKKVIVLNGVSLLRDAEVESSFLIFSEIPNDESAISAFVLQTKTKFGS